MLVVKGAPEQVLANCAVMPQAAHRRLDALFAEGRRVVAVASRPAPELTATTAAPFFAAGCDIIPPGGWIIGSLLAAESSKR